MSDDIISEALAEADQSNHLGMVVRKSGVELDGKGVGTCPACTKKKKFSVYPSNGRWFFKCMVASCDLNSRPGEHGLLGWYSWKHGVPVKGSPGTDAISLFLADVGVEDPRGDSSVTLNKTKKGKKKAEKKARKKAAKAARKIAEKAPPVDREDLERFRKERFFVYPDLPESDWNVWERVHAALTLHEETRADLMRRGMTSAQVEALGFVTTAPSNEEKLRPFLKGEHYEAMRDAGIITQKTKRARLTDETHINPQLRGWLVTRSEAGKTAIIPYIDGKGRITYLRPHKGGCFDNRPESRQAKGWKGAHIYGGSMLAPANLDLDDGPLVVTEGEFKSIALWLSGIPSVAQPGAMVIRTVGDELGAIISDHRIRQVVFGFDEEDKASPTLPDGTTPNPGYKEDPQKRYDAEIWARYSAWMITRQTGATARVAFCPMDWADPGTLKVDWDGALGHFLQGNGKRRTSLARAGNAFAKVVSEAIRADEQGDLFLADSEREKIVRERLNSMRYQRLVPIGTVKFAEEAERFADTVHPKYAARLGATNYAADARACVRCFYEQKPLSEARVKFLYDIHREIEDWIDGDEPPEGGELQGAKTAIAFIERVTSSPAMGGGMPVRLADFTMKIRFVIEGTDRQIRRDMVITHSNKTLPETTATIPNDAAGGSQKFREWLKEVGPYNWRGNQTQLVDIWTDLEQLVSWRVIRELDVLGYHEPSKLSIYGGFGTAPPAEAGEPEQLIFPDEDGVLWHEGVGYRLIDDNDSFQQGLPFLMSGGVDIDARQAFSAIAEDEESQVKDLLVSMAEKFMGSYAENKIGGLLPISVLFSYLYSPEFYKRNGFQPSIWFSGLAGHGKSDLMGFLLRACGYSNPVPLDTSEASTMKGLQRTLASHSCLPVMFDEARRTEMRGPLLAMLRAAYGRSAAVKAQFNQTNKTNSTRAATMPIIGGESMIDEQAIRTRYMHFVVSASRRSGNAKQQGERYREMKQECTEWYRITRHIALRRSRYAAAAISHFVEFNEREDAVEAIPDGRTRQTHAYAYGALAAVEEIIPGALGEPTIAAFASYLMEHASAALAEVRQENNLYRFWQDICTMMTQDSETTNYMMVSYNHIDQNGRISKSDVGPYDETGRCILRIAYEEMYAAYEKWTRQQGREPVLSATNIKEQAAREPYWIKFQKNPYRHRKTLPNLPGNRDCWAIDLGTPNSINNPLGDLSGIFYALANPSTESNPYDGSNDLF